MVGAQRVVDTIRELARYVRCHTGHLALGPLNPAGPVVSVSTIPSRLHAIQPALRSLRDQTLPPSRLLLALPTHSVREGRAYQQPKALASIPGLEILPAERDWGPATKVLASLREYQATPDQPIVFADDDSIYPRTFLETLVRNADAKPDAAIALRGWQVPASLRFKDAQMVFGTSLDEPTRIDVVTGCGGVLVRPRFFDDQVFAIEEASHEFYVDDVWLSGHLARRGVAAYVVPIDRVHVYWNAVTTWVGHRLDHEENRDGVHDDAVLSQFAADWPSLRRK